MDQRKRGFTTVEILIALGIVALIGALAALAVNSARSKQRDAVRLSQVTRVQSVLENHFNGLNAYPAAEGLLPLGDARVSACLSEAGFEGDCSGRSQVYLRAVLPTVDGGLDGLSLCGTPVRNAFCYASLREGAEYRIQFELENDWPQAGLRAGINCATQEGIASGPCRQ